jgi:hypothetical protein
MYIVRRIENGMARKRAAQVCEKSARMRIEKWGSQIPQKPLDANMKLSPGWEERQFSLNDRDRKDTWKVMTTVEEVSDMVLTLSVKLFEDIYNLSGSITGRQ